MEGCYDCSSQKAPDRFTRADGGKTHDSTKEILAQMVAPRNITGEKFGRLTAIELDFEKTIPNKRYWLFDCECGRRVSLPQKSVTNGNTSSCGCLKLREDLTGKRFTRLLVQEKVGRTKAGDSLWRCLCDCGAEKIVAGGALLQKKEPTRSCGCWARDQLVKKTKTHGMSDTPEFKLWGSIKSRCKPDGLYGQKGIFMSNEWADSFEVFYRDIVNTIGLRPSSKHQLDRILGGTSPYQKDNVRWLLSKENCRNKTNNRLLEFNGETKCLSEWAELYGIKQCTLEGRLERGWNIEDALKKPLRQKKTEDTPIEAFVSLPTFDNSQLKSNRGQHGFVDLTGQKFGKLTVTRRVDTGKKKETFWEVICDCGNLRNVNAKLLKNGQSTHCGCSRSTNIGKNITTHGLSKTPEHQVWLGMKQRCKSVPKYTNKGIKVAPEWADSFEVFYQYLLDTIGLRPSAIHQIDRIDGGSSDYCPGNIRWVTPKENTRNMTTNRLLTYQGETKCLSEWAEQIGIKPETLRARISNGWSLERALSSPLQKR